MRYGSINRVREIRVGDVFLFEDGKEIKVTKIYLEYSYDTDKYEPHLWTEEGCLLDFLTIEKFRAKVNSRKLRAHLKQF